MIYVGRWGSLVLFSLIVLSLSALFPWILRGRRGWWAELLRTLSVLFLILLLIEPFIITREFQPLPLRVAVAVDVSESMGLKSGEGRRETKLDRALSIAEEILEKGEGRYEFELYGFGKEAISVKRIEDLKALSKVIGKETRIGDSLLKIVEREDPEAIILISDGHNTGGIEPKDAIALFGLPFILIPPGLDIPNISISCSVQKRGYVGYPMPVVIQIKGEGLKGKTPVTVLLEENGKETFRKSIDLDKGMKERNITVNVIPKEVGKRVYKASIIPPVPDSIDKDNLSTAESWIEDRRIRVFYVEGKPRWECRFLRRYLEDDPGIRCEFLGTWVKKENRPFRGKELREYDLIIFGDLSRDSVWDEDIRMIDEYVGSGGGIVFMGGKEGVLSGRYKGTALDAMLPVDSASEGKPWVEGSYEMRLTEKGESLLGIKGRDLPDLLGYNPVGPIRPGAEVLAIGPNGTPILSIRRYGLGKAFSVASDTTWRWSFLSIGAGGSDEQYRKLWGGIIRATCREGERSGSQPIPQVVVHSPEMIPGINEELLREIADLSGGAFLGKGEDPLRALERAISGRKDLQRTFARKELINKWALLVGVVSSLTMSWILMRRHGL